MNPIVIASDHAGRELKEDLKELLLELGSEFFDMGPDDDKSVDYPDYGIPLSKKVSDGDFETRHTCLRHRRRHEHSGQ